MKKNLPGLFTLSALSLALISMAGCGGGGGGEAGAPVAAAQRTVQGTAAKGIIKGAQVQVYSLDAAGKKSAQPIATAVTAADGTYTVTLPADVLLFSVEVIGGAGATMADEASGKDVALPASFKLRSVVKLAQSAQASITSSVSPLTEMIVQAAEKAGGLSATNIDNAKSGFAAAFGFDPEQVKPVNSNSTTAANASEQEKLQSLMLAAISKMAQDSKLGCGAATLSERLSCVAGAIGKIGTLKSGKLELDAAIQGDLRQALTEVAADPLVNRTGNASAAGLPSFPPVTPLPPVTPPLPPVTPPLTDVQLAKKLIASLRTTITVLSSQSEKIALDVQADTIKADFDKAIAPLDQSIFLWAQFDIKGLELLRAFKAGETTQAASFDYDDLWFGGCAVYSSPTGNAYATTPQEADHVRCHVPETYVQDSFARVPNSNDYTYKTIGSTTTLRPVAGSASAFTYSTELYQASVRQVYGEVTVISRETVSLGNYGNAQRRATGTISFVRSGALVSQLTIAGKMPARYTKLGVALTDHELWNLTAKRSAEGGNQFKYAWSGEAISVKDGVQSGKVTLKTGSFVRTVEETQGSIGRNNLQEVFVSLSAEAGASTVAGSLRLAKPMADKNGRAYLPTSLVFNGSMATNNTEFFNGSLSADLAGYDKYDTLLAESAGNFVRKNVSLTGTLSLPGRPPLSLGVSANQNAFERNSYSGQYSDGSITLNVSVSDASPKAVAIASTDGVSLSFGVGAEKADLMKGSAKVAVVNLQTGVINYTDGSFESLK